MVSVIDLTAALRASYSLLGELPLPLSSSVDMQAHHIINNNHEKDI